MSKRQRTMSFRQQIQMSMKDMAGIIASGQSPSGNGKFTTRTIEIAEPSTYGAASVRQVRRSLNLSQAMFARLLGVSGALVRAWELGTRCPAPMARRLLDQVRDNPAAFASLVRASEPGKKWRGDVPTRYPSTTRSKRVA